MPTKSTSRPRSITSRTVLVSRAASRSARVGRQGASGSVRLLDFTMQAIFTVQARSRQPARPRPACDSLHAANQDCPANGISPLTRKLLGIFFDNAPVGTVC